MTTNTKENSYGKSEFRSDWISKYNLLKKFYEEFGHSNVQARERYLGIALGNWVVRQRTIKDKLTKEQLTLLKKVKFNWDPNSKQWDFMLKSLLKFYERHGHTDVPINYAKDPNLGKWVFKQRQDKRLNKLSKERIKKLEYHNFIWNSLDFRWLNQLLQLREFYGQFGHFFVPANKENSALCEWKNRQIRLFKSGELQEERIQQLLEIGFDLYDSKLTDIKVVKDEKGKFSRVSQLEIY